VDKPIDVTTLPLDEYGQHLAAIALGPDTNENELGAEWRAMGLLEGELDLDAVGQYSAAFRPVLYDPTDRTIYQLEDVTDDLREFYLYQAMTLGLLDQHFDWSVGFDTLGPAARSGTLALVEADASATALQILDRATATSSGSTPPANGSAKTSRPRSRGHSTTRATSSPALAAKPRTCSARTSCHPAARNDLIERSATSDAAVLDGLRGLSSDHHQIGAPAVLPAWRTGTTSWLAGWARPTRGTPSSRGRDETLFDATADGDCVSAAIGAIDEPGRTKLLGAFQAWAALAPPESKTTVAELGTERISVTSCDPGSAADTKADADVQPWAWPMWSTG